MSCGPCFKLHPAIHHLDDCYPPTRQLEAEKEPRPLKDGLIKLSFYTKNHPNQLSQIAKELERRITKQAFSGSGQLKSKSSLLISLSILKSLLRDCDLTYLLRPSLNAINRALASADLQVIARACSCFSSLATRTDASPFTDTATTKTYTDIVRRLADLCDADDDQVSFAAIIGLVGAAGSEALSWSDVEAERQINIIMPPLLNKLWPSNRLAEMGASLHGDSDDVFHLTAPTRRALSVHGEKPPDVALTAMRGLKALLEQCRVNQVAIAVDALLRFFDNRWGDAKCDTFCELFIAFAPLEYQHLIPKRLLEALHHDPQPGLINMLTTTLRLRCVGQNVTVTLQALMQMIPQRTRIHERDALLPLLVQCISTLAAQIYYPDQIGDMIEGLSRPSTDKEALRIQVWCMVRTMEVAHAGDAETYGKGKASGMASLRRNPVGYDVWAETLHLLCDEAYSVRAAYIRALGLFIEQEMPILVQREQRATLDFCNLVYSSIYILALSNRLGSTAQVATPFDYANILEIVKKLDTVAPLANLMRGGPVLLAMDRHAGEQLHPCSQSFTLERKRAIRETVTWAWDIIGRRWQRDDITALCRKTISMLPEPLVVPDNPLAPPVDILPLPDDKAQFVEHDTEGETSATVRPLLDPEVIISSCAAVAELQRANIATVLSTPWTLEHIWDQGITLDDPVSAILLDDGTPHATSAGDWNAGTSQTVRTKRQPNKAVLREIFKD